MANPIDVVIAWVDGNDPEHRKRREHYADTPVKFDDINGETRYANVGEIAYCIASLNRFAPFIRRIFVVTDNQNPGISPEHDGKSLTADGKYPLSEYITENFTTPIPMEVVDHRTIFKGYGEYLPTFNCNSIETMFCRIPGLSEQFVYFNDDVLLLREACPETFFEGNKAVAYGYWHLHWTASLLRILRMKRHGHKEVTFRDIILNSADLIGLKGKFFRLAHTPHPLLKSVLCDYFDSHPEAVIRNIRDKFRSAVQYNPQSLFQNIALQEGKAVEKSEKGLLFYLKPKPDPKYMANAIKRGENMKNAIFMCMNSLDEAAAGDQAMLFEWLTTRLGLNRPYKPVRK